MQLENKVDNEFIHIKIMNFNRIAFGEVRKCFAKKNAEPIL
jgi:hypothetical protein